MRSTNIGLRMERRPLLRRLPVFAQGEWPVMGERWDAPARLRDKIEVDFSKDDVLFLAAVSQHAPPGIDDERVTITLRAAGKSAILARSDDVAQIFGSARPSENMPMRFARDPGEGGRYGKHLRTCLSIGAVEAREPQIVADRKADDAAETGRQYGLAARGDGGALAIFFAVTKADVEEMTLVVAGDDAARRINHKRAIEPAAVFSLHADRADKEPGCGITGGGAQRNDSRVIAFGESQGIEQTFPGIEPDAIFRKRDQPRSGLSRPADQAQAGRDVRRDVGRCRVLNTSGFEPCAHEGTITHLPRPSSRAEKIDKGTNHMKVGANAQANEPFAHVLLPIGYGKRAEPGIAGKLAHGDDACAQTLGNGLVGAFPALDLDELPKLEPAPAGLGFEKRASSGAAFAEHQGTGDQLGKGNGFTAREGVMARQKTNEAILTDFPGDENIGGRTFRNNGEVDFQPLEAFYEPRGIAGDEPKFNPRVALIEFLHQWQDVDGRVGADSDESMFQLARAAQEFNRLGLGFEVALGDCEETAAKIGHLDLAPGARKQFDSIGHFKLADMVGDGRLAEAEPRSSFRKTAAGRNGVKGFQLGIAHQRAHI